MIHHVTRRSALKVAMSVSFGAAWLVAGCSKEEAVDTTIKTGEAKPVEESIQGAVSSKGATAPPSPKQRLQGGPG